MRTTDFEFKTVKEIASLIIDAANDGRLKEASEIHNEVFNTDYFIIGIYQAEQWLIANTGVFQAVGIIKDYEQENFGEVTTDLSEAERVCNMIVYIIGEAIIGELDTIQNNYDSVLTPDQLEELKNEINTKFINR